MDSTIQSTSQRQASNKDRFMAMLNAPSVVEQFKKHLNEGASDFTASLIELFQDDSKLQECNPKDIVAEAAKAAAIKLPLIKSLGYAYLLPFRKGTRRPDGTWVDIYVPTLVIGYKGYIQMALRTGQYRILNADVVYDGEIGRVDKLRGEINFDGERKSDNVIGYFAHFELMNGFRKTLYMSLPDMCKYAKTYSPSIPGSTKVEELETLANMPVNRNKVGWLGNFNDMALKTVMRRLIGKYGYLSTEMQKAMASENEETQQTAAPEPTIVNVEDVTYQTVTDDKQLDKQPDEPNY